MKAIILNGNLRNGLVDWLHGKRNMYHLPQFQIEQDGFRDELEELDLINHQLQHIPDIGGNLVKLRLYDEQLELLTLMLKEDIDNEVARRDGHPFHLDIEINQNIGLDRLEAILYCIKHAR